MNPKYRPLFTPFTLNNGVEIKNRLVVAPMTHWASDENGQITDAERAWLKNRFNGFGLFISAATLMHASGKAFIGEPESIGEEDLDSLREVAQIAHDQGAKAILQLHHGGIQSIAELSGGEILSPSPKEAVSVTNPNAPKTLSRELTDGEIRDIIAGFGTATGLAIAAGFDGVEIHGANGYLLQQFYSAEFNQRTDEWGGSQEKRMRFPLAVVDAVTAAVAEHQRPDFIVGYRFSPEEPGEHGITMADTFALIDALVQKPLQYLHISLFDFYKKARRGADTEKTRIEQIHARINGKLPLIGVGNLTTADDIANALDTGWAEFIALGKAVMVNPNLVELIESGRENEIQTEVDPENKAFYRFPELIWQMNLAGAGFLPKMKGVERQHFDL